MLGLSVCVKTYVFVLIVWCGGPCLQCVALITVSKEAQLLWKLIEWGTAGGRTFRGDKLFN